MEMGADRKMTAIIVAGISAMSALLGHFYVRLHGLEENLKSARAYNLLLWEWARKQLDLYYRYRREDAPDPDPVPKEG